MIEIAKTFKTLLTGDKIVGFQLTSWGPCLWRKTKEFLSTGNLTLFLCKFCKGEFYCFVHQHGCCLVTLLKTSNKDKLYTLFKINNNKIEVLVFGS